MAKDYVSEIIVGEDLQKHLIAGISKISSVVKRTLGPGGQPIIIQRHGTDPYGKRLTPLITKDGVTVAEAIKDIDNVHENNVLQVVKDIARKTNEEAGDGTTTSIVLAEAITKQAQKRISSGYEPQLLLNELNEAVALVLNRLTEMSTPITNAKQLVDVASISANNNLEIGRVINDAIEAVGEDGVITLQEGSSKETTLTVVDGFRINRGLLGQGHFVTHPDSGECILGTSKVILYNGEISRFTQLLPIVQYITDGGTDVTKSFFIIAHNIVGEALNWLIINKSQMGLRCGCIKGPDTTSVRSEMMEDISVMLGATLLGEGNRGLENFTPEDLGSAEKIVSGRFTTTIYVGGGDEQTILKRVSDLKALRGTAISPHDLDTINQRIACLSNGVAVIYCGGSTDVEIREKKDRIEDALNATRAAKEKGIVPGGGVALLRAREVLRDSSIEGYKVIYEALELPIRCIIENTGLKPDVIIERVKNSDSTNSGYNARTGKFVDLLDEGVIDPTKVVQSALLNSLSIAGLLTTCGGSIAHVLRHADLLDV